MIITTSILRTTYQYVCNYNYTQQHADDLKKKFNTVLRIFSRFFFIKGFRNLVCFIKKSLFSFFFSETPDCKIYFTSDGSKPSPFQRKIGGREVTFKYTAPFTLKAGKRTLKAVAVTRYMYCI